MRVLLLLLQEMQAAKQSAVQEIGVRLGTNSTGELQFTVTDTVEEAQEAARALQVYLICSFITHSLTDTSLCVCIRIERTS